MLADKGLADVWCPINIVMVLVAWLLGWEGEGREAFGRVGMPRLAELATNATLLRSDSTSQWSKKVVVLDVGSGSPVQFAKFIS